MNQLTQLQTLLHQIDGHLGLAVHRNTHDDQWKAEALELIAGIRFWLTEMSLDSQRREEIARAERKVLATLEEYRQQIERQ